MSVLNDKIFNFAYGAAMRDATLRTAYQVDGDEQAKKDARKALVENEKAKGLVQEYINALINETDPIPDFYDLTEKVKQAFGDENFRFGNVQKLINMTAKFLFIATYNNESLRDRFKPCHCPMDSIIVKEVKKQIKEKLEEDPKNPDLKKLTPPGWIGKIENSWSRMESRDDGYDLFQNLVDYLRGNDCSRLEFDYLYWKP